MATHTTQEICDRVDGELIGPGDLQITGIEQLDSAQSDQLTFIRDDKFAAGWALSHAGAAIVAKDVKLGGDSAADDTPRAIIRVDDADLGIAAALEMFAPTPVRPKVGTHERAHVDPSAQIGAGVAIGVGAVIGANVSIGDHTTIHPNVTILDDSQIGQACEFFPGVVIRERCELGSGVILHANVTIGSDGFGYRPCPDGRGLIKIPHIGTVVIGDGVEIGANSCVDRGKFSATTIGDGTKIDNLCQIAHNCKIGRCCIIAGQSGTAGSVTLGDGVIVGGDVAIRDGVTVGPGAMIAGAARVIADVPAGGKWAGYMAQDAKQSLRENAALRKLPDLLKRLRHLEAELKK